MWQLCVIRIVEDLEGLRLLLLKLMAMILLSAIDLVKLCWKMGDTRLVVAMLRLGKATATNLLIASLPSRLVTNQKARALFSKCVVVEGVAVGVEIGLEATVTDLTVRKTLTTRGFSLKGREAVRETKCLSVV